MKAAQPSDVRERLANITKPAFRMLMHRVAIGDATTVSAAELDAYLDLLRSGNGGRAFLRIMRGFERTAERQALYHRVLHEGHYPVQIVWGADDSALKLAVHGEQARLQRGSITSRPSLPSTARGSWAHVSERVPAVDDYRALVV